MPFKTRHVLNSILARGFRENRLDLSPMKAQKMLFYTHGWHLATTGTAAIDRNFEAWDYGPVVGEVYQDLKRYGSGRISNYVPDPEGKPFIVNLAFTDLYRSLDIAWEKYIGIPAVNLSAMTHEPGSPWDVIRSRSGTVIPNEMIREYFVGLAKPQA